MRKVLLCIALVAALALAGCAGKKDAKVAAVTCPDGTVLTPDQIKAFPDFNVPGFNATKHCPVKPSVTLHGIPATLQSFKSAPFSWSLDAGSVLPAHSMLTSIRYYDRSVPDRDLTNINKYPTELVKKEHQNLPISYDGTMSFAKVGKVYIRAYMEVGGVDYWSDEVALTITPVQPSGKVIPITQGAGDFTSPPSPADSSAVLGDAIKFVNQDARDHVCSFNAGPAAVPELKAAAQGESPPLVLVVPGVYEFSCDDLQAQTFKVNVVVN